MEYKPSFDQSKGIEQDKVQQEEVKQQEPKQETKVEQPQQEMTKQEVNASLDSIFTEEEKAEYLSKYVGEGKKYRRVEDLAKAYAHSEQFIRTLKQEKAEIEEEVERLREAAKLVKDLEKETKQDNNIDIDSKVQEALQKEKQKEMELQNRQKLKNILLEHFKDENKAVETINRFINNDPNRKKVFNELAAIDPNAAAKLLGIDSPNQQQARPKVNTTLGEQQASSNSIGSGVLPITWSQAREIRKSDPVRYKSHKFQSLLHKAALEAEKQGINFFNT